MATESGHEPHQAPSSRGPSQLGDAFDSGDAPTEEIAVTADEPSAVPHRAFHGRSALLIRAVAAVVIVAAVIVTVSLPDGDSPAYRVASDTAPRSSASPPGSVSVPGLVLPGGVPPAAAAPAAPGPGGAPVAAAVPLSASGSGAGAPAGPALAAPGSGTPGLGATPLGTPGAGTPGAGTPGAGTSGTGAPGATPSVPLAPGGAGLGEAPLPQQRPCSLGWPAPGPDQQGGLASFISLAPFAGPFTSEAFALGSVYQPVLQLAGPVIAEIEPIIKANMGWIQPLIGQVQAVEAVVLEAILPYYGPYRQQLLNAEVGLAQQLTPILQRIYASDSASCLVAWEAQIINRAKGKRVTVASLAHPGRVITLGPRR